jgi:hypothetical protein
MMDQMMDAWEEQIKSPNPVIVFLGDLFRTPRHRFAAQAEHR